MPPDNFDPNPGESPSDRPVRAPVVPLRKYNYLADGCPSCGSRRVWCHEDHEARCLDCSASMADFSKAESASDFDFVRHPTKGWLSGTEISSGIAGRPPDPESDPFARHFREAVERRQAQVVEGQELTIDQIQNSIAASADERDLAERRAEAGQRFRSSAAAKAQRRPGR